LVAPGTLLDGKYMISHLLGEGGMGSVYVAHNEALDLDVAIKIIRGDLVAGEEELLADRLLQEARAAARIGHPAILRVFDLGRSPDGDPYIVMELLEGEDLATVIDRRGRINPVKAVQTLLPIAHALAAAHDKGIVHRDVKPENVFLARAEDGGVQPKLIDFGVAKLESNVSKRLTLVGSLVGSPAYMSPEQARGDEVDQATDIWAVAVVLYEMIGGQLPFDGSNYNQLMRAIIEDRHEPLVRLGVGDEELSAIVDRGLQKFRAERWRSMRAFGAALASWLVGRGYLEDVCGGSLQRAWLQERASKVPGDALDSIPPPPSGATPLPGTLPLSSGPPFARSSSTPVGLATPGSWPATPAPPPYGTPIPAGPPSGDGRLVDSSPLWQRDLTPLSARSPTPNPDSAQPGVVGAASPQSAAPLSAEPPVSAPPLSSVDAIAAASRSQTLGLALIAGAIVLIGAVGLTVWALRSPAAGRDQGPSTRATPSAALAGATGIEAIAVSNAAATLATVAPSAAASVAASTSTAAPASPSATLPKATGGPKGGGPMPKATATSVPELMVPKL